ncbi:MAG: 16S rRNA (adenine(1518)-N(6)/adenine(1519)-N(6))-dimethyltransferase RsmA [Chitinophagaceae bacterium]
MEYTLKKTLGQHFLKDDSVIKKIIASLAESKSTTNNLLEIGPGAGALTKYLLQVPSIDFKAVEIDHEKVVFLQKKFPALKGKLIEKDFLEMEPPFEESFRVIGNFPYNISTQILFKVLAWKHLVPEIIGMFQKEVALRIAAAPGNKTYGITSVLVQAFYDVEYLFDISPQSFTPPPKVMSGMIRLKIRNEFPEMRNETYFFRLVKSAFNQRRKMLRNAVKPFFTEDVLKDELFNRRAETLSVDEFAQLTFRMQ